MQKGSHWSNQAVAIRRGLSDEGLSTSRLKSPNEPRRASVGEMVGVFIRGAGPRKREEEEGEEKSVSPSNYSLGRRTTVEGIGHMDGFSSSILYSILDS